jgi:hypothetical protein
VVISLDEEREKRRKQKQQYRDVLKKLLLVTPSEANAAPKRKAKIAIPCNPDDPSEPENLNRGRSAAQKGEKYSPKSTRAGYACGYLQGIISRELNKENEAWEVDWTRFDRDIRKSGEVFDDELEKMPNRRPKRASQRVHDICIMLDMIFLTKHYATAGSIIAQIKDRYAIEDGTAWALWDRDIDFVPWIKPLRPSTPIK